MNHRFGYIVPAILTCGLLVSGCSKVTKPEVVVAVVGDRAIGADEFALAYELAPRTVTSQAPVEARLTVLDGITKRILLADAAEKLGLDDDMVLQRAVDLYRRQAINRELYRKYVRTEISVSEVEERAAYERSNKRLFVKHQAFDDLTTAEKISVSKNLKHEPIHPYLEPIEYNDFGPVDIVEWNDVDVRLDRILCALPVRQISQPVPYGGKYHVFQVVEIERNAVLRENDFQVRRESLHGIIRKQKEKTASAMFVHEIMTPEHVTIKRDALNRLTTELWVNRPQNITEKLNLIGNREIEFIADSSEKLGEMPLAVFRSGRLAVSDILFHYKVNPQKIDYSDEIHLRESLKNMVGMYVRDWVLSERGIHERLDHQPEVRYECLTRNEQLLAEKMLRKLYSDWMSSHTHSPTTDTEFEKNLNDYVRQLQEATNIIVNTDNLMAVKTSDEGLSRKIDFVAVRTQ